MKNRTSSNSVSSNRTSSNKTKSKKEKVAIIMGSKTDFSTMKSACKALDEFSIPYKVMIVSAHRTPKHMISFAEKAHLSEYSIIIAGAGGAAHLPGMVASVTPLPVIGVPVDVGLLKGLDALFSIVQMPKGVPVATVGINNAFNAGLLACRMIGLRDNKISKALLSYQKKTNSKSKQDEQGH